MISSVILLFLWFGTVGTKFCETINLNSLETHHSNVPTIEEYGLVKRKVIPGKPAHTEYSPTEKGMAVQRILAEIAPFRTKYEPEIIFVDKKPRNNMKSLFGTGNLSEVYDFEQHLQVG